MIPFFSILHVSHILLMLLLLLLFVLLAVDINPNGRCYASGAEDGYVRLHFFDKSYLDMKDPVPEAEETDEELDEKTAE